MKASNGCGARAVGSLTNHVWRTLQGFPVRWYSGGSRRPGRAGPLGKIGAMPELGDLYRRVVLASAGAAWVRGFVERHGFKLGVGRFIAGRDVTEALPKLQAIQAFGKGVIIDVLGEFVTSEAEARQSARRISEAVP